MVQKCTIAPLQPPKVVKYYSLLLWLSGVTWYPCIWATEMKRRMAVRVNMTDVETKTVRRFIFNFLSVSLANSSLVPSSSPTSASVITRGQSSCLL